MNNNINSKSLKEGDKFFQNQIFFAASYFTLDQMPKIDPSEKITEVVLFGRSNVGKSSLLNALAFNQKLAYTSKMPGCTKSLNFYGFRNNQNFFLVDLPGYGYAKLGAKDLKQLNQLIMDYFLTHTQLKKIYLLIDSRIGVQPNDAQFIQFFNKNALPYQIVLTKIDKAKKAELIELENILLKILEQYPTAQKNIIKVSSAELLNISELRANIAKDSVFI